MLPRRVCVIGVGVFIERGVGELHSTNEEYKRSETCIGSLLTTISSLPCSFNYAESIFYTVLFSLSLASSGTEFPESVICIFLRLPSA